MTIKFFTILKEAAFCPAFVINIGAYLVFFVWTAGCQNVRYQTFIETSHRKIHCPTVVRAPMPIQYILSLCVPVPFYVGPYPFHPFPECLFYFIVPVKVLPCAKQSLEEVR